MKCKNCKYEFNAVFGIGMGFPKIYEKTITAAKNGELGEEIQKFFAENPDGAVDVSNVLSVCKNCGECETVRDLTMYLPKENIFSAEENFQNTNYVMPNELKKKV